MSDDESRRGARGWLAKDHTYRRRIVDEIQKRADYPLNERARVTRLMMAGPTATDYFRKKLLENYKPNHETDENSVRRELRHLIQSLEPGRTGKGAQRSYRLLSKAIREVTNSIPPVQEKFRMRIDREFAILRREFEPNGALHFEPVSPALGRDRSLGEMPFRNGGAGGKFWLNLSAASPRGLPRGARVRLHREVYPANETFSVWEDYTKDTFPEDFCVRDPGGVRINTDCAAIDSLDRLLEEHPQSIGKFQWVGHLLSVYHLWVMSAAEAFTDLSNEDLENAVDGLRQDPALQSREVDKLFQAAADFAQRTFPHQDPTSGHTPRQDHVISLIGEGEVILIADLQAHSRQSAPTERASRYALVNLSASPDKLGRIAMRLHDIDAYRLVALRDYQFSFPVTTVIDACNAHIAKAENTASRKSDSRPQRRERMRRLLNNILELSSRITAANHFIEKGLVGLADQASEMQRLIHTRLEDLNERPIRGFQSLSGYLRKVDNSINSMARSKARYQRTRDRIDEIVNLTRAELNQVETESAQLRAFIALLLSAGLIGIDTSILLTRNPDSIDVFANPVTRGAVIFLGTMLTIALLGLFPSILDRIALQVRGLFQSIWRAPGRTYQWLRRHRLNFKR